MNELTQAQLQAMLPSTVFLLIVSAVSSLLSIGIYIIASHSLHTIAKRRLIAHPWLAWLPIGNLWILGSVADHYRLCSLSQVKHRRRTLMIPYIVMVVIMVGMIVVCVGMIKDLQGVVDLYSGRVIGDWWGAIGDELIWLLVLYMLIFATLIVQLVFTYIAYYDLFCSCDPRNAVIYLVLSILFPVILPVFLFACRHKQNGLMPKRRAAEPWQ